MILSDREVRAAIGRKVICVTPCPEPGGAQRLGTIIATFGSKGIDIKDLTSRIAAPIEFRLPQFGSRAFGYEATVLADLCDVILAARKAGLLHRQQKHFAEKSPHFALGWQCCLTSRNRTGFHVRRK